MSYQNEPLIRTVFLKRKEEVFVIVTWFRREKGKRDWPQQTVIKLGNSFREVNGKLICTRLTDCAPAQHFTLLITRIN